MNAQEVLKLQLNLNLPTDIGTRTGSHSSSVGTMNPPNQSIHRRLARIPR